MQPSLFAPPGLDLLVGTEPLAQQLHKTALRLFSNSTIDNGGLSTEEGSLVDLFCFMLAISLAVAATTVKRVDAERTGGKAYFSLSKQEKEHQLSPAAADTLKTRRAALTAAKRVPRGSRRAELEQMLRDLLGDDYLGLHVSSGAEVVSFPEDLGLQPQLLIDVVSPRKLLRIIPAICTDLGGSKTVQYEAVDPLSIDSDHTLVVGDKLVIEPELLHRAEVVTITAVSNEDDGLFFTAEFDNAHEPNCWAVQMPFPVWTSTQRQLLIALSADAASDPDKRGKANVALEKTLTGVTTWALCGSSGSGTIGPWTIGDPQLGKLGQNPLGIITVP
jgi:hypothetical protein